jgi:protein-S-isoprenylcysteine O-methyltransferase Ste14
MTLRAVIDALAMLACSVYCTIPLFWLVVHPFIARWRRHGRRSYRRILPIWAIFITTTFLILWPLRFARYYANWWSWIPAASLFLTGFFVYSEAFKGFRREQVSGLAELEPDRHRQELVTSGIRAHVRHPIYLGHLCEILGWCVGTGLTELYALAGFAVVTGLFMVRIEDRELEARFGNAFREYRDTVPAVIPRLKRRSLQ